jgi:hypothetical protein
MVKLLIPILRILPASANFSNTAQVSATGTSAMRNRFVTGSTGVRVSLVCSKATGQWIFEKLADSPNQNIEGDLKWYQVEVKIVGLKIAQSLVDGFLDVIRVVMGVPEFAGDLYAIIVTISDRESLRYLIVRVPTYKDVFAGNT